MAQPPPVWQIPLYQMSLDEAHAYLIQELSRPLTPRDQELRSSLKEFFTAWHHSDNVLAVCGILDELLFGRLLGHRVGYVHLPMTPLGMTELCHEHSILSRDWLPPHNYTVISALRWDLVDHLQNGPGCTIRKSYAGLWGTLIHEMLHAYTILATATGEDIETCHCGIKTEHGPKWTKTITMLAARLNLGITPDDMTNRLEVCHEPGELVSIRDYTGLKRTDGRRYSHSQTYEVIRNTKYSRDDAEGRVLPLLSDPITAATELPELSEQDLGPLSPTQEPQAKEENLPCYRPRRRRETFPGRMIEDFLGIMRLDCTGETMATPYVGNYWQCE